MQKIKVSIKDENTLILMESASKGDIVDLNGLHDMDVDKSTIENVVKSIKMDQFNAKLKEHTAAIEREHALKLENKEKEFSYKAKEELSEKEKKITELNSDIKNIKDKSESEAELKLLKEKQAIKDDYESQLKEKDNEVNTIRNDKELSEGRLKEQLKSSESALINYKEMRTRMSTKMLGESLELHCENEFNKIRSMAFPNAEF